MLQFPAIVLNVEMHFLPSAVSYKGNDHEGILCFRLDFEGITAIADWDAILSRIALPS